MDALTVFRNSSMHLDDDPSREKSKITFELAMRSPSVVFSVLGQPSFNDSTMFPNRRLDIEVAGRVGSVTRDCCSFGVYQGYRLCPN